MLLASIGLSQEYSTGYNGILQHNEISSLLDNEFFNETQLEESYGCESICGSPTCCIAYQLDISPILRFGNANANYDYEEISQMSWEWNTTPENRGKIISDYCSIESMLDIYGFGDEGMDLYYDAYDLEADLYQNRIRDLSLDQLDCNWGCCEQTEKGCLFCCRF